MNNGIDRCKSLTANAVDCPPGWSITDGKIFDSDSGKGSFYCFKNAGLSYGWDDLCQSDEFSKEGARRVRASELGRKQLFLFRYIRYVIRLLRWTTYLTYISLPNMVQVLITRMY